MTPDKCLQPGPLCILAHGLRGGSWTSSVWWAALWTDLLTNRVSYVKSLWSEAPKFILAIPWPLRSVVGMAGKAALSPQVPLHPQVLTSHNLLSLQPVTAKSSSSCPR